MAADRRIHRSSNRDLRRRFDRVALTYLLAVLVSGLVVRAGFSALSVGGDAMGVPWLITGSGGVVGAGMIVVAARYARGGLRIDGLGPVRVRRAILLARLGRLLMLVGALGAALASVLLAPTGVDRMLSLAVGTGLAGLLAVFALLARDLTQVVAVAHRGHAEPPEPTRAGPAAR